MRLQKIPGNFEKSSDFKDDSKALSQSLLIFRSYQVYKTPYRAYLYFAIKNSYEVNAWVS